MLLKKDRKNLKLKKWVLSRIFFIFGDSLKTLYFKKKTMLTDQD